MKKSGKDRERSVASPSTRRALRERYPAFLESESPTQLAKRDSASATHSDKSATAQGRGRHDARAAVARAARALRGTRESAPDAVVRPPLILVIGEADGYCAPYLESIGVRVIEPVPGANPVALTHLLEIDVVVIDFETAPVEGRVALQHLKTDSRARNVPVVAVSTETLFATATRQCAAVVRKPLTVDALVAAIDAVLEARRNVG